jgi:hypothetical protein
VQMTGGTLQAKTSSELSARANETGPVLGAACECWLLHCTAWHPAPGAVVVSVPVSVPGAVVVSVPVSVPVFVTVTVAGPESWLCLP